MGDSMIVVREQYAPGVVACGGGLTEIRWDVVGCNLSCQFCWSLASNHQDNDDPTVMVKESDVDLGDGRRAVAEDDTGGLDAELLPQLRGGIVPQLVRVPAMGPILLASPGVAGSES